MTITLTHVVCTIYYYYHVWLQYSTYFKIIVMYIVINCQLYVHEQSYSTYTLQCYDFTYHTVTVYICTYIHVCTCNHIVHAHYNVMILPVVHSQYSMSLLQIVQLLLVVMAILHIMIVNSQYHIT